MPNIGISRDNARSRIVERCTRAARNAIVGGILLAGVPPIQSASTTCRSVGDLRLPSPDRRREMLLYVRISGEETSGQVAIVRMGAPVPDGSGNIDRPGVLSGCRAAGHPTRHCFLLFPVLRRSHHLNLSTASR